MILLSIGLPSDLADWCDAVLARLAESSGQPAASIILPASAAELPGLQTLPILNRAALHLVGSNADHIVVAARFPDADLRNVLARSQAPFLLSLDDPRPLVGRLMDQAGQSLVAATRTVASLCPLVMRFENLPGCLAVRPADARQSPAATIAAIAQHVGMTISDEQAQSLSQTLPYPPAGGMPPLNADDQDTVDGALGAYAAHFAGQPLGDLVWTADLFSLAYEPGRAPTGAMPMRDTDDQRCLVQGPLMRLPAGAWSVQVNLRVNAEGVGQTLILDLCSSRSLAAGKICPLNQDNATAEMPFTVDDETQRDIQLRLFALRERLPGQLLFGPVVMRPIELRDI